MQQFKPDIKVIPVESLYEYLQRFFTGVAHVRFCFDAPEGLQVATDEDYLRTIMQNLTNNAIHALKNNPDAFIQWKARPENGRVVLTITDNGPGMSQSQLKALYTNDAAIIGKSGLGLHLIRDLARAIACQISVRSEQGAGTEFQLTFA
ncbi:HAMP domain-containing sensor histidine kinase [Spirosoma telluris]|uniref:sensor histidine kinase n=1 Tax=Spirosoma telluris TaxID=2183553 RepID=UPI002FC306B4